MSGYPRLNNGYYDYGTPVRGGNKRCPNCNSTDYKETVSREHCKACGLECDYWGGGANPVYERMMNRNARIEEDREYERRRKEEEEFRYGSSDD